MYRQRLDSKKKVIYLNNYTKAVRREDARFLIYRLKGEYYIKIS